MDKESLWKAVLSDLELDLSATNFSMWLKPTSLTTIKDVDEKRQIVTVACRTPYQQTLVESRYYGQIKEVLDRITGKQNELVFLVQAEKIDNGKLTGPIFDLLQTQPDNQTAYLEAVQRSRLRSDYIFDTFAVSSTNEMAHAAASAVARNPGKAYQLLFLYGGVGVGKTHLMTAIGHEVLRNNPDTEMVFCSGEEFMNELVQAIQTKQTTVFKNKYRKPQVLLVDDIQFIAGKDAVQEEFFHTFNAIVQNQGQIVLTSDKLPEEMVLLEDRLRSRFEGGLTIDIQAPNLELRTAILNIKAKARGVELPTDVAQLIAAKIEGTRKLEGFLMKLITQFKARQEPITPETVESLLGVGSLERPKRYIPINEVLEVVANHFMIKPSMLKGKKRVKEIVDARHAAMYLMRVDLEISLQEVGRFFGGKDHTTIMHAVEKIKNLLPVSEKWRRDISEIRKHLLG